MSRGKSHQGKVLHTYFAPPSRENLEVRIGRAPPNVHRWVFMWAIVEVSPNGETKILDGTGQNGHPGSVTLEEAFTCAKAAYESIAITLGATG